MSRRWLALLGFPLAFGYPFAWGLFAFVVAAPLVLVSFAAVLRHDRAPSLATGLAVTGLALLTGATHLLALGALGLAAGLLALSHLPSLRAVALRWAPLVLPGLALVGWMILEPDGDPNSARPVRWELGLWRLPWALGVQLGGGGRSVEHLLGALVLATPLAVGATAPPRGRGLPAVAVASLTLLLPVVVWGVFSIPGRFMIFAVPLWLAVAPTLRRPGWARPWAVALLLVGMGDVGWRHLAFDREAAPLHAVLDRLPAEAEIAIVCDDARSRSVPGLDALAHLPQRHQVRGGRVDPSFAGFAPNPLRYGPPVNGPRWWPHAFPDGFDPSRLQPYDAVLVCAPAGGPPRLPRGCSADGDGSGPGDGPGHGDGPGWWLARCGEASNR